MVPKKKRGPAPTGKGTQVQVRLQPDLLTALDRFIAEQKPDMSRPEALRYAFRDWAVGQGLLSSASSMTDDQMSASADKVRLAAADAADEAMAGMDATKEQRDSRRQELTDEPALVGKARGKALPIEISSIEPLSDSQRSAVDAFKDRSAETTGSKRKSKRPVK